MGDQENVRAQLATCLRAIADELEAEETEAVSFQVHNRFEKMVDEEGRFAGKRPTGQTIDGCVETRRRRWRVLVERDELPCLSGLSVFGSG